MDSYGNSHDVKLTLTIDRIRSNTNDTVKYAAIWSNNTVYAHLYSTDDQDHYGGVEIQVQQQIVGAAAGQTTPFAVVDLDQGYATTSIRSYPNQSGTYSGCEEQVRIVSGALSQAYLPDTHFLNIVGVGNTGTNDANGLAFFSTKTDSDTYNSGFAVLLDASDATFIWLGCACGTELYNGSVQLSFKPVYKAPTFSGEEYTGISEEGTEGDDYGSISLTNVDEQGNSAAYDPEGSNTKYCAPGKEITFDNLDPTADGWKRTTVTENGDVVPVGEDGKASMSATAAQTEILVTYEPITATVKVTKKGSDGKTLSGATFTLSGKCEVKGYEQNLKMTATSGSDGVATFSNVPYGTYTVTETSAPDG